MTKKKSIKDPASIQKRSKKKEETATIQQQITVKNKTFSGHPYKQIIFDTQKESDQFLQSVFDAIRDGISVLDTDLNVIRTNYWMEKMYASQMPLQGQKCYTVYQQRELPCPWCPTVRTIETGEINTVIVPYPSADDPRGWIELSTFPLKDAQGHVMGVIEYVKDISDRKKAEHALCESEEKFRQLFDQAADLIAIIDLQGNFIDLNIRFEEESGWSREEMIGKNVLTSGILTEESVEKISYHLSQLLQDEEIPIFEIDGVKKDGGIVPYELRATPIKKDNKTVAIQAILRNMTERKVAEQELRKREEELQSVFRASPVGIGLVSYPDRQIAKVNKKLCEMLGYTEEELTGKSARIFYPSDQEYERVGREKYKMIQQYGTGTMETNWQRRDGSIIDILLSSTPLDSNDLSLGITFTVLDISDRKKADEEIQHRVRELEEFYNMAVGRELRMKQLKEEINDLKEELEQYRKQ
ncbi:MAG: PAS domain S-box protein [Nitrospirota bacterium]